ncbi:MAG: integrase core domain-containing protein [Chitinophagaceae bacterium]
MLASIAQKGKPEHIRVDNGAEFLSNVFTAWCLKNGYIECLNRTFREDVLDAYEFENLEQLRILYDEWHHY